MDSKRQVELLEKNKPRQERAKRTYEAILASAAQLLVEVGVERISTNLIADRALITVPALYRYFPNKYAVLHALGSVLMDAQNKVFQDWIHTYERAGDPLELLDNLYELFQLTYDVTRQQVGGLEIAQALRAVGPLQELRLAAHNDIAREFAGALARMLGRSVDGAFASRALVSVDSGYGIIEMALENTSLTAEITLHEGARMIRAYWLGILLEQQC